MQKLRLNFIDGVAAKGRLIRDLQCRANSVPLLVRVDAIPDIRLQVAVKELIIINMVLAGFEQIQDRRVSRGIDVRHLDGSTDRVEVRSGQESVK